LIDAIPYDWNSIRVRTIRKVSLSSPWSKSHLISDNYFAGLGSRKDIFFDEMIFVGKNKT